jgi:hypothetical protein
LVWKKFDPAFFVGFEVCVLTRLKRMHLRCTTCRLLNLSRRTTGR